MDAAGHRAPSAIAAVGAVWLLAAVSGAGFWTAFVAGLLALAATGDAAGTAADVAQVAAAVCVVALVAMVAVGTAAVRRDDARAASSVVPPRPRRPVTVR